MAPFNQQMVSDFAARLRERASQLRGEIQETLERSADESHVRIAEQARDNEDDSFANLMVDLGYSDVQRDAAELVRIDGALRRIEGGSFGVCVQCGQDIPLPRLEAEPSASRCIDCQSMYEKTHATGPTPSL
jgi:RNA polymerase-binding protein DksA